MPNKGHQPHEQRLRVLAMLSPISPTSVDAVGDEAVASQSDRRLLARCDRLREGVPDVQEAVPQGVFVCFVAAD